MEKRQNEGDRYDRRKEVEEDERYHQREPEYPQSRGNYQDHYNYSGQQSSSSTYPHYGSSRGSRYYHDEQREYHRDPQQGYQRSYYQDHDQGYGERSYYQDQHKKEKQEYSEEGQEEKYQDNHWGSYQDNYHEKYDPFRTEEDYKNRHPGNEREVDQDHHQYYHEENYQENYHQDPQGDHCDSQYQRPNQSEPHENRAPPCQLRLVKLTSDVVPENQKVAIIDGRGEGVSIGRDRSFSARIRCPSMEVSKHHANIFRMGKSRDVFFAVADTGSTHGTFLLLDSSTTLTVDMLPPITEYQRLSPPKQASVPKTLRHMSLLRVGQTVFQAHLHSGWSSCVDCALNRDGSNEIALLAKETVASNAEAAQTNKAAQNGPITKVPIKQAMRDLRSQHLGEAATTSSDKFQPDVKQYVDRAAARRARGGVQVVPPTTSSASISTNAGSQALPLAPAISKPAAELDASNRGFQMFSSMSAKSEAKLAATHEPIFARGVEGRAGLGSKRLLDVQEMASRPSGYSAESVRERQRRRFEEAR